MNVVKFLFGLLLVLAGLAFIAIGFHEGVNGNGGGFAAVGVILAPVGLITAMSAAGSGGDS